MKVLAGVDFSTKAEHVAFIKDGCLALVLTNKFTGTRDFAKRMGESPSLFDLDNFPSHFINYEMEEHTELEAMLALCDFVVVETYFARFDKHGEMGYSHWRIRTGAAQLGMAQSEIAATEWKKGIGIHGHAQKEDVKLRVQELYPQLPGNLAQDCYDAIAIAHASWNKLTLRTP